MASDKSLCGLHTARHEERFSPISTRCRFTFVESLWLLFFELGV